MYNNPCVGKYTTRLTIRRAYKSAKVELNFKIINELIV